MAAFETRITQVSLHGRFTDSMTRRSVPPSDFQARLEENGARPICKEDGSFAFIDLEPRATSYSIRVQGRAYRTREITAGLPTHAPVALAREGEDEVYLRVTAVVGSQDRIQFDAFPFLPTIGAGAEVIGEGGFSASLETPLEGENVDFAELSTVAGLSDGNVVRIVRSERLLLRPGPYYSFQEPATVLSVRFLQNTLSAAPIAEARMRVDQVNDVDITTVNVGGLVLHQVLEGGNNLMLGPASAIEATSNLRGEALLDFPAYLAITSLRIQVSHPHHDPLEETVTVTAGEVSRRTLSLTPN